MYIWIVGGMGGILFSSLIDTKLSVGASTSLMATLGAFISFIVINWKALESNKTARCILFTILLFVAIMQILFGFASPNVDNWGHLGGILSGFFLGLTCISILRTDQNWQNLVGWTYEKVWKYIGIVIISLFFFLGYLLFYISSKPIDNCIAN